MTDPALDLDAVRAFVRVADLGSFTRAAEALQTSQAGISLRLKRLEARLGQRLLERTPRHVALSAQGAAFLAHARQLLQAHDHALASLAAARQRLTLGISDHVAGPDLPRWIASLHTQDPGLLIEVRIGSSGDLLQAFDRRELDAVLARLHTDRDDGEVLATEAFSWFAAPHWQPRPGEALPVVTMAPPCGVRALASELLDAAGIAWGEVFVGGGVSAVAAAVMAGLGVAALAPRMLPLGGPSGAVEVGSRLGLPALPALPIVLHRRSRRSAPATAALAGLAAAFRAAACAR